MMNPKNKEFLLKHLSIVVRDLDAIIEEKRQQLLLGAKYNYFSLTERVNQNAMIVHMLQEKILATDCIIELENEK